VPAPIAGQNAEREAAKGQEAAAARGEKREGNSSTVRGGGKGGEWQQREGRRKRWEAAAARGEKRVGSSVRGEKGGEKRQWHKGRNGQEAAAA